MNFDLSEEQRLLADGVRRMLEKHYDFEARKRILASAEGWSREAWTRLAELGVLGVALGTEHGGFGGGAADLMGVLEAAGAALVLEPIVPTIVAGRLLERAGSAAQRAQWLPALVAGRARLALATTEASARNDPQRIETRAQRADGGWRLSGSKRAVAGGGAADAFLLSARTDEGLSLFLVPAEAAGLARRACRLLDGTAGADLFFSAARLPLEALVGEPGGALAPLVEALDFGAALVCAEAVGAMQYACEATLEYLKTRRQFGVPIGSFQALQHRMVDMTIALEQARSLACLACSKVDGASESAERARAVSLAKIGVNEAARLVAQEAVQLHGGMGMTEELKVSHSFRRLTALRQQYGDTDGHLARVAALDAQKEEDNACR